ncbi:MAG TPA: 5'-3' exonuclease H3TH domain-containing protein [Steroidobacteraceae bacterium]|nr:5'-3' exonuclease H3TH domain-containing protein [Steroidobacteraceae bacterium]
MPLSVALSTDETQGSVGSAAAVEPRAAPIYLIDASIFIFRAFHSVPIDLTDPDGQPVNAVHGFGRFIGDLIESESPAHIAVAFDESLTKSFRNELYPRYKANREPAPVELQRQFAWCREFCSAYGLAHFANSNYEADDLIGTLAARARARRQRTVLVTRDKDLSQLIRPGDVYWDYIGERRYEYAEIPERFGVRPERMADFLALTGDAVDNVPGVPGVGKKTASQLLTHFESLEHLYDNLDAVFRLKVRNPGFVVGQLRDHRETAFLARKLTAIFCEAPIDAIYDCGARLRCGSPDLRALGELCDRMGFGRLLRNQAERIANRAMALS